MQPYNNPILSSVTMAKTPDNIAVFHDFEQRFIKTISPKGYYYLPSLNDQILISSVSDPFSLGVLNKNTVSISPGEILIKNDAGAYIKLCSSGDIEINNLKITKDGKIISP